MAPGGREGPQPEHVEEHEGLMAQVLEGSEGDVSRLQAATYMLPHQDAPSTGQASTEGIEW
eukprot:CAMPEP_0202352172 /NCGR_PEP_ID=MMETSP1126-20121109/8480_1 /ASSEMBLY_ACC=CAM_ASM_000457 /TAXON_ID=3047 /ORGANISM="Dunaliella tertiolecta, Strain CCMP1320" /LENGTH=60 /DNA_ID=CAMNT_0048944349 /DNA_START=96 /DNA_END=275 /DNA_ORIENTATION=+